MAKNRLAVCRLCRREGIKLFLKGRRCLTEKCAVEKRAYAPGQHGKRRPRFSDFGVRLREKQKIKRIYGISERKMKRYYQDASKTKGVTGELMLQLLERRLDNVVFRLNFALSRAQAREIVNHGHICVNTRRVNIPSYLVKVGDVITVKDRENSKKLIRENLEICEERPLPNWLQLNKEKLEAKVDALPKREDIVVPIQEQLVVEFYSR